jgi:hypothetical protein
MLRDKLGAEPADLLYQGRSDDFQSETLQRALNKTKQITGVFPSSTVVRASSVHPRKNSAATHYGLKMW